MICQCRVSLTPDLCCCAQVPTTLMAVVDAAVGIKTAVNFHNKKNKLGTYQPPLGVLYDTAFLQSLESRHISNGSAEVFKMACIKDARLFERLEMHGKDLVANKFQVGELNKGSGDAVQEASLHCMGLPHAMLIATMLRVQRSGWLKLEGKP